MEKEPISEEQIEKSVKSYLEKNPIEETDPTVPAWAKEEEKPTYTAEEVGALPSTTVIPSKLSELTADDEHETVTKEEKQAWNAKSDFSGEYRDLKGKPELAEWVLQSRKPTYTASEVGALPSTTEIPKKLSDMGEDTTHRTVTDTEKQSWNNQTARIHTARAIRLHTTARHGRAPLTTTSGSRVCMDGKRYKGTRQSER